MIRRIQQEFIPVAIPVPRFLGDHAESRFYRSLTVQNVPPTSGSPIPQGVCVVTADGRVLAWTQIFRDESAVHEFLDTMLERFRAVGSGARQAKPVVEVPPAREEAVHQDGQPCPGAPPGQRGSLAGVLYGRALDPDGNPRPQTGVQQRYMQERISIPRDAAEALASRLRGAAPGTRIPVPEPFVRALLREMHLGMKDASLLSNPVGAPEQVRRLELDVLVPGGEARTMALRGRFEARVERKPLLEHEQELDLEGALELDARGVARLALLARGQFRLRWRGFDEDAARFRMLMAGRTVEESGGIRYGLTLTRLESGPEHAADLDPVEVARVMLGQLAGGGRDVSAWRARLDALAIEFAALRAGKPASFLSPFTFPRRMEALLRELTAAIQASMRAPE